MLQEFFWIVGIMLTTHNDVTDVKCTVPEESEISWVRNISLAPSFWEPNWQGKSKIQCTKPKKLSQKLLLVVLFWAQGCRVGKITTAEEIVINGCSNCCKKCAHKPLQANVWEQSLNFLDKLSNYTTSSEENLSASERCYWIAYI